MINIRWSELAVIDLESIKEYISRDSVYYAAEFTGRIIDVVEKLYMLPKMGRMVPETNAESIRELIYRNYRIIYKIEDDENNILILAVIHATRNLKSFKPKPWEEN